MKRALVALCLALSVTRLCHAIGNDLLLVYGDALRNDPQLRGADAQRRAARENAPQAIAALLPQVSGSYAGLRQEQDAKQAEFFPSPTNPDQLIAEPFNVSAYTKQWGYTLQLRQSIFSWANWETLRRANKQVAQAEADYRAAEEDLIQRVATAYFNVLSAQDTLDAQQAALEAISRQLDQANQRFDVGLIAVTDVKEAQAARDSAAAAVIDAKRQLASNEQALREITNQEYSTLAKPGDDLPLKPPQPADPEQWVSTSMEQNLSLVSSRLQADIARDAVGIARGGHFPTIDLSGTRSQVNQSIDELVSFGGPFDRLDYPTTTGTRALQLQVTVPIFSGGATQSQVRQAQYLWIAAKERMSQVSRQTEHLARDSYSGVISEVARVQALRQGLESAQTALKATEAGYDVGTRTAVEVLTSRQNLVQAQTNYAQSRYNYILDILALRLAAGTLDRQTVQEVNQWLDVTQPTPTSPVTQPTPPVPPQP